MLVHQAELGPATCSGALTSFKPCSVRADSFQHAVEAKGHSLSKFIFKTALCSSFVWGSSPLLSTGDNCLRNAAAFSSYLPFQSSSKISRKKQQSPTHHQSLFPTEISCLRMRQMKKIPQLSLGGYCLYLRM